ncbi:MAG: hypothetical protein NWQ46_09900 [Spirosomaceae bacterium]|nr:hypothetical protein [Spirosomataceae bacterium]
MLITSSTGNSRTVFPSRPTIVSAMKSESRMASSGREKAKFIGFQIPQGKLVYIPKFHRESWFTFNVAATPPTQKSPRQ